MEFSHSQVSNHDVQLANTRTNDASMWSQKHWQDWSGAYFHPQDMNHDPTSIHHGQLITDSKVKNPKQKTIFGSGPGQSREGKRDKVLKEKLNANETSSDTRTFGGIAGEYNRRQRDLISTAFQKQNTPYNHDTFLSDRDRIGSHIGF